MEAGTREPAEHVMAVHCRQNRGGQFIDVHVVDADNVPKLPPAETQHEAVSVRADHEVGRRRSRPRTPGPNIRARRLLRDDWQNLNGHWDYAITPVDQTTAPAEWDGKILVPFCLESKLGGVQRLLDATEAFWYRRTFNAITDEPSERTLLNFEAVDYRCEVFVNGKSVGDTPGRQHAVFVRHHRRRSRRRERTDRPRRRRNRRLAAPRQAGR